MEISARQGRVIGCLIEKAETTPDGYPLSSGALRAACNQVTNRDPVVDFAEREVDALMLEVRQLGLARTVTGSGHRVGKHKHVVDEALGLDGHELAVLAVLLLRGAQTLNEITTRTARYARGPGGDAGAVDAAIDRLAARAEPLVVRRERRPGEREPRIEQCWVESVDGDDRVPTPDVPVPPAAHAETPASGGEPDEIAALTARVEALEAALAEQTRRLDALQDELGG